MNPADPDVRDKRVFWGVLILSGLTLAFVMAVLCGSAVFLWTTPCAPKPEEVLTSQVVSLGTLISTTGLAAVGICLLLRLRNHRNDLLTPPALTGPIIVVLIGASVAVSALFVHR